MQTCMVYFCQRLHVPCGPPGTLSARLQWGIRVQHIVQNQHLGHGLTAIGLHVPQVEAPSVEISVNLIACDSSSGF